LHLQLGKVARAISCDTSSSYEECEKKLINKNIPSVDVLVNCAGISIAGTFDELPVEEFQKMLNTNVRLTLNVNVSSLSIPSLVTYEVK
jgi:short-subunit dehydrogenase